MDSKDLNIHKLITELIIKELNYLKYKNDYVNTNSFIKSLRAKSFALLLKKKCIEDESVDKINSLDPLCNLLAWQYKEKKNKDKHQIIGTLIKKIEKTNLLQNEIFGNSVLFLLNVEENSKYSQLMADTASYFNTNVIKNIFGDSKYPGMNYQIHSSQTLNSPNLLLGFNSKIFTAKPNVTLKILEKCRNDDNIGTIYYKNENFDENSDANTISRPTTRNSLFRDEGYDSLGTEIWPIVSQQPRNNHYLWEYFDNANITLEKPFACESNIKTVPLFQTIIKQKCLSLINCNNIFNPPLIVNNEIFVKYVKFMLVGTVSIIFLVDDFGMFYLRDNICVEDLSQGVLKSYCSDLIFCGSCFRNLSQLCANYTSSTVTNCGYVFKELCESIKKYLSFYRLAVLSLPETTSLLTLHKYMRKMKMQIGVLSKICKIGPYASKKIYQLPQSSELLTYLYKEVLNVTDKDLALVLYSAFYPCCEIYLRKFLQQWLFEGILIDPYEEFLIKIDEHYTKYRTRVYWTRNFSLKQNALPEFLLELKNNILLCGKTMNLLKLCKPETPLCRYTIDQSNFLTCCLTSDQLTKMKQNMSHYYIEIASLCGPTMSLSQKLREREEQQQLFLSKVKQKQAMTLRRIELERQKVAEEKVKKKRKIYEELLEQIKLARIHKKKEAEEALQYDLIIAEQNAQLERKKAELLKEEAKNIIRYYDELFKAIEDRKASIEKHKEQFVENLEDRQNKKRDKIKVKIEENIETEITPEKPTLKKEVLPIKNESPEQKIILSESSSEDIFYDIEENQDKATNDVINANINEESLNLEASNVKVEQKNVINEAFQEARRNRAKIMNLEFGVEIKNKPKQIKKVIDDNSNLTEAQRNKRKVMRSEYQMYYDPNESPTKDININDEIITENHIASPGEELIMNINHQNNILSHPKMIEPIHYNRMISSMSTSTLSIDNEAIPMSIGSTPSIENLLDLATPSTSKLISINESTLNTACTLDTATSVFNEDGFKFPSFQQKESEYNAQTLIEKNKTVLNFLNNIKISSIPKNKREENELKDICDVLNSNVKYLLYQSIYVPLQAQTKLVNSEMLHFFLEDQKLFSHLRSLRCYYFLLDGEFGRHITEGVFNKLYEVRDPIDLLNGRFLQFIMNKALGASSKVQENSEKLSFTIQNIPQSFNLSNADVLDCLSMSYKINWPLNILLPSDTMEKYELIFKYLLKLHHVSWILQKTFQELKVSCWKGKGIDFNVLIQSRQYHRLQLHRHVMTNFIQTLQNYTVSEVLQSSWEELQHNMESVTTLDQLYTVHIIYLKTIIFRCLLNKQCAPIMRVINEIFVVILKFYNQLRSRRWKLSEDGEFIHPSYKKLENIFNKFEEFANFVFKVGHKMAKVGYQPHLVQMLDMLNMNGYYTNKQ